MVLQEQFCATIVVVTVERAVTEGARPNEGHLCERFSRRVGRWLRTCDGRRGLVEVA